MRPEMTSKMLTKNPLELLKESTRSQLQVQEPIERKKCTNIVMGRVLFLHMLLGRKTSKDISCVIDFDKFI